MGIKHPATEVDEQRRALLAGAVVVSGRRRHRGIAVSRTCGFFARNSSAFIIVK